MLFTSKIGVGLDVDDLSLELVMAQSSAKDIKQVSLSRLVLPAGVISNGLIKDEQKLSEALKKLLVEAKPRLCKEKSLVLGVPHSQFYPALVELPISEGREIAKEAIWKLAQENLPVPADDLLLDYKIIRQQDEVAQVLIAGVSREYLLAWQKFLKGLEIEVEAFDIGAYALWRDLSVTDNQEVVAVVDIGACKTNVFVFSLGQLNYSYDFEIGGDYLTQVLADKLSVNKQEAERQKIKRGLAADLLPAWELCLYEFAKELVTALTDYQAKTGLKVKEIKLVGGGAKLKGLVNYLSEKIPLSVSLGTLKNLEPGDDALFIQAGGSALKMIKAADYQDEPVLLLSKSKKVSDEKLDKPNNFKEASADQDLLESEEIGAKKAKFRLEKKLLGLILLLGLLVLGGVYWYRNQTRSKQVTEQVVPVSFSEVQSFPYKLTIGLDKASSSIDLIGARILDDRIEKGGDFDQLLLESRNRLLATLSSDEELWAEPLNEVIDKSQIAYPMTLRWLAFNKAELLKLALAEVDRVNVDKVPYEFNAISKTKLEKTDSLDRLFIYGELTVSLNQKINNDQVVDLSSLAVVSSTESVATEATSSLSMSSTTLPVTKVLINKTETGWLNARKGPSRNEPVLTKLYPGEIYEWLTEEGDWWQLALNDGRKVWILSKYGSKQ